MVWISLIAGLSLSLYGLRLMGGGVQKSSGTFLRSALMAADKHRLARLLSGGMLSLFMLSTTGAAGAVVGLVNSGLYRTPKAYDSMVGVNLGGIITMWLLTVLSFTFSDASMRLSAALLVALCLILMLFRDSKIHYLGEIGMGIGMVLFGVALFHHHVGLLLSSAGAEALVGWIAQGGLWTQGASLATGFMLALCLSSSVGAFIVAVSIYTHGILTPLQAVWLVVGINLGSALAVYLGALKGNRPARRMGAWHLIFNLFGLLWFLLLAFYLRGLEPRIWQTLITAGSVGIIGSAFFLPLIHTLLNGGSAALLLLLRRFLDRMVEWLGITDGLDQNEVFHLRAFTLGLQPSGEIALLQAQGMTLKYARRTYRMFGFTRSLFEPIYQDLEPLIARVEKYARISMKVEGEIVTFLDDMRWGDLSERGRRQLGALLRISTSIQSLASGAESIAGIVKRKQREGLWFNEYVVQTVQELLSLIDGAFGHMEFLLQGATDSSIHTQGIAQIQAQIATIRDAHQSRWEQDLAHAQYTGGAGVLLTEIIGECERMGRTFAQIANALQGVNLEHQNIPAAPQWREMALSAAHRIRIPYRARGNKTPAHGE